MSTDRIETGSGVAGVNVTIGEDNAGPGTNQVLSALEAQIGNVVASATAPTQPVIPGVMANGQCCEACGQAMGWDPATPIPEKCHCGGRIWIGDNIEQARQRAETAKGAAKPDKSPRKLRAPKANPTVKVTIEEAPEDVAAEAVATFKDERHPKERQKAAQVALIAKLKLDTVNYKEVGEGVVDAIGYTIWVDNRPQYIIQEPIETAMDMMRQYRADRIEHPGIRFDAARIQNLPDEVNACSFKGQIVATLVHRSGVYRVKQDEKVKIGAKVSGTGSLVWAVLK